MRRTRFKRQNKSKLKFFFKFLILFLVVLATGLIFAPEPYYKECFKNLQDLQYYASKTNENTPMENNDTLRPEFTNYYKSLVPTFLKKLENKVLWILSKVGITQQPVWDITAVKYLVEDLGVTREKASLKDNFVYRIQSLPNSKFIIFGNLQGAFHSLVRCLVKLKEIGIIDESLKITQPQNYIIFMGDVIDRSPFTLETLSIVMRLVQVNPNNIIYLRGNHESNNYWQEHTLKIELQIRASKISNQTVPLEKEVNLFFNTLPLAVYLNIPNSVNDFIRISDSGRSESTILNESNFADTLNKQTNPGITYFALKEKPEISDAKVNIKVIIRGEKKRKTFQKMEGIRLLAPDMDSVAWNLLSCPNIVYQKALDFFYDSFAIVNASEQISNWEIWHYHRDLRTSNPFTETKYNFISGLDLETHKKLEGVQQVTNPPVTQQQATPVQIVPAQQQPAQQVQQSQIPQAQVMQQAAPTQPQVTPVQATPVQTLPAQQQTTTPPVVQQPAPIAQPIQPVQQAQPAQPQAQVMQQAAPTQPQVAPVQATPVQTLPAQQQTTTPPVVQQPAPAQAVPSQVAPAPATQPVPQVQPAQPQATQPQLMQVIPPTPQEIETQKQEDQQKTIKQNQQNPGE